MPSSGLRDHVLGNALRLARIASFEWDLKNDDISWSKTLSDVYGESDEPPTKKDSAWIREFVHPEDLPSFVAAFNDMLAGKDSLALEHRVIAIDGRVRHIRITAELQRDTAGKPKHVFGVLQDMTNQIHSHQALRESEARFRTVFEQAAVGIALLSLNRRFLAANQAFGDFTGYSEDELMLRTVGDVTHPDDSAADAERADSLFESHTGGYSAENRYLHKSGALVWGHAEVALVRGARDRPLCFVAVVKDITLQKRIASELEARAAELALFMSMLRVGILSLDAKLCVTFVNPLAETFTGTRATALIGRDWQHALPVREEDRHRLEALITRPQEGMARPRVRCSSSTGTAFWLEIEAREDPRVAAGRILFLYDVSEVQRLESQLDARSHFSGIVGKSGSMKSVFHAIEQVARVDWTVLVQGETGSGKELVARAIHDASIRKDGPFIAVNCAALSDSLLTSQLFGHKRGAFTGAVSDQKGLFEAADKGTLFLDEIGDISNALQASLLRVLEEKTITRLGETTPHKVDVRIIVATHRDLDREVEQNHFRADLFYRLRSARISIPPLRKRRDDIPLLAQHFLLACRATSGLRVNSFSTAALRLLLDYDWPGNVRELKSAVEFAVLRATGDVIDAGDLPRELEVAGTLALTMSAIAAVTAQPAKEAPVSLSSDENEKRRVLIALEQAAGNRAAAARLLGLSRATLYRRLSELGISK